MSLKHKFAKLNDTWSCVSLGAERILNQRIVTNKRGALLFRYKRLSYRMVT